MPTKTTAKIQKIYYLGGVVVSYKTETISLDSNSDACCYDTQILRHLRASDRNYDWEYGQSINGTIEYLGYRNDELCCRATWG